MKKNCSPQGMTVAEFFTGMLQFVHNRDHPEHRCECKNVQEMVMLHFEYHKLIGKIHERIEFWNNIPDVDISFDMKDELESLLENEK